MWCHGFITRWGGLSFGTHMHGSLQVFYTRWSFLRGNYLKETYPQNLKSLWKFGKCSKGFSMTKSKLKKTAVSWGALTFSAYYGPPGILVLSSMQHQMYLELSYQPNLSDSKLCCFLSFLQSCEILGNSRQNICSRVMKVLKLRVFSCVIIGKFSFKK